MEEDRRKLTIEESDLALALAYDEARRLDVEIAQAEDRLAKMKSRAKMARSIADKLADEIPF